MSTAENFFLQKEVEQPIQEISSLSKLRPAVDLIRLAFNTNQDRLFFTQGELKFTYKIFLKTILSCIKKEFTCFDALTSTTCCHGLSVLTKELIEKANLLDLKKKYFTCLSALEDLEKSGEQDISCNLFVDEVLILLGQLYILSFIKEEDANRLWKTNINLLKTIENVGTKFTRNLVANLQTLFSNKVAESYYDFFLKTTSQISVSSFPVKTWAKYVYPEFIREDKRGRKYASCLYSMQVTLGYLISTRSKIALINDIRNQENKLTSRYIKLFEGDGVSKFIPLNFDKALNKLEEQEPILVFGGCAYSNSLTNDAFEAQLGKWLDNITLLFLACDTHYPQFPRVSDDVNFNSSAISHENVLLHRLISKYQKIEGVSSKDPSLFCLAHIYTASCFQIIEAMLKKEENILPFAFLSEVAKEN